MKSFSNRLVRATAMGVVGLGVAFTALGSLTTPASSALISADLLAVDDGLLTQDTDSRLEWLDLTETLGQSYNAVALGFGDFTTIHGFGIANVTQVFELFTNRGISSLDGGFREVDFIPALDLIDKLGCTTQCSTGSDLSRGYADLDPNNALSIVAPFVQIGKNRPDLGLRFGRGFDQGVSFGKMDPMSDRGVWLYRGTTAVVPLPAALPLFGTGLGILGFLGWRRRRKTQAV